MHELCSECEGCREITDYLVCKCDAYSCIFAFSLQVTHDNKTKKNPIIKYSRRVTSLLQQAVSFKGVEL